MVKVKNLEKSVNTFLLEIYQCLQKNPQHFEFFNYEEKMAAFKATLKNLYIVAISLLSYTTIGPINCGRVYVSNCIPSMSKEVCADLHVFLREISKHGFTLPELLHN